MVEKQEFYPCDKKNCEFCEKWIKTKRILCSVYDRCILNIPAYYLRCLTCKFFKRQDNFTSHKSV